MGLNREINLEREMVYPFIDGASSNEYSIHPSPYCFMLPYEIKADNLRNECRLLEPEELKEKYPLTYARIMEFKKKFKHDPAPLSSADYVFRDVNFCSISIPRKLLFPIITVFRLLLMQMEIIFLKKAVGLYLRIPPSIFMFLLHLIVQSQESFLRSARTTGFSTGTLDLEF